MLVVRPSSGSLQRLSKAYKLPLEDRTTNRDSRLITWLGRPLFLIGLAQILFNCLLCAVIVAARLLSFVVFGHCAVTISFGVPRISPLDVRPHFEPTRVEVTVDSFGKCIPRLLPVALLHIQQTYLIPRPGRT